MTPEEKAKELAGKIFMGMVGHKGTIISYAGAKAAALIFCDEIIEDYHAINDKWNQDAEARIAYWHLVKTHIQSL